MSINDETEDITLAPLDFDDNVLDEWIAGGDVTKHYVTMYGKPQLAAEFEKVEDELRLAKARAGESGGDELGGSEVGRLQKRLEEIYEEWAASKSRWLVGTIVDRIVDEAEAATVAAVGPEPVEPEAPAKGSPASKKNEHAAKLAQHETAHRAWTSRQNAEIVLRVVEHIEFADGRRARISSPDQVLRMRETFGEHQILKIIHAARLGRLMEPELSAPFSSGTSQPDQT